MDFLTRKLEEKKIDLEFEEGYKNTFGESLVSVKQALTQKEAEKLRMVREQYQRMYGFMHPNLKVTEKREAKGFKFRKRV